MIRRHRSRRVFSSSSNSAVQARRGLPPAAEPLERRVLLADIFGLLKDVNDASVGPNPPPAHVATSSNWQFETFTQVNDKAFFTADRAPLGRELWVSDGTQADTRLVKDINPTGSSYPINLTNVGGTLLFMADDGSHGFELWKSDGTEAGTVMVKDIVPGPAGSNYSLSSSTPTPHLWSAALPGAFVFTTNNYKELWRSDGTAEGTYRLKEAGLPDDAYPYVQQQDIGPLWASNGLVYFTGSDPDVGRELWTTDGTVAGTRLLKDIRPGKDWSAAGSVAPAPNGLTYFTAITGGDLSHPVHSLFRTDGTTVGTQPILEGPMQLYGVQPLGGLLYFVPRFPLVQPNQVWRSDGTAQGTVKAIEFPPPDSSFVNVASVDIVGTFHGQLLLYGYKPETGWEYWLSDGTQQGTRPLMENPGPASTRISALQVVNDQLYFVATTPEIGSEPYRSDGTPEGTVLLKDIVPGPTSSFAYPWTVVPVADGRVVFPAQSAEPYYVVIDPNRPGGTITYYIHDLFVTDGTPAGTQKLETVPPVPPMRPETKDSMYTSLTESGGMFYFGGIGPDQKDGLWRTDGTAAGTVPVTNAVTRISHLMDLNGTLLFLGTAADDGVQGLYRSDGTAAGTVRIAEMSVPRVEEVPSFLALARAVIGDRLYFTNGPTLWKTDGTRAGTTEVGTFNNSAPGFRAFGAVDLTPIGNTLFFVTGEAAGGSELWKTDGTPAGTVRVKAFDDVPNDAVSRLVNLNGMLYFVASDAVHGREVWKSDGTEAGTVMVKDVLPGPDHAYGIDDLTAVGNRVYFTQYDGTTWRLWRTDGTAAGTEKVHPELSFPHGLFLNNGKLYFVATSDGTFGIYALDVATDGLTKLAEGLGLAVNTPAILNGRLYWVDGRGGVVTDGTPAGTRAVARIESVPGDISEQWTAVANDDVLVFGSKVALYGREPWRIVPDGAAPAPRTATVAGRHVFYDNSYYNSFHRGGDAKDDFAIATDKEALLPGQTASFANVTSYTKGINGVVIDVRGLPAGTTPSADDFIIRSGPGPAPPVLAAGPSDVGVSVRRGAGEGGSDRVTLTWPDGAIKNKWLQVTMKSNGDTGLARPDVFYFGNLVGETGDRSTPLRVSALDLTAIKRNLSSTTRPVTSAYDVNRDGKVNALDIAVARGGYSRALIAIAPPAASAAQAAGGATSLLQES